MQILWVKKETWIDGGKKGSGLTKNRREKKGKRGKEKKKNRDRGSDRET